MQLQVLVNTTCVISIYYLLNFKIVESVQLKLHTLQIKFDKARTIAAVTHQIPGSNKHIRLSA